ncbi:hypothetical protein MSAN_02201900 [Mycena sanguinolenta]|uniref:NAD(P)-binding protein n=1 Tax=Mycena sanguinolenta TaxID=230812 RepID=A0A8H6XE41_9AGAR|nr:hypothetical protein MSAN_02201900 [Mycena sanguinolenta]
MIDEPNCVEIVLVVGASRGIGLALVHATITPNTLAVAGPVQHSTPFPTSNVKVLTLDLADYESIVKAASSIPTLIINAGTGMRDPVSLTSIIDLAAYLDINVLGPHRATRVVRAFLTALRARNTRRIVAIFSSSGSLTQQALLGSIGLAGYYDTSKAALNMLLVQFHKE